MTSRSFIKAGVRHRPKPHPKFRGEDILSWLSQIDPRAAFALGLVEESQAKAFVVGGAIRDYFLGVRPSDVDLVIPNDETRLFRLLETRYPHRTNRHGNRRYFLEGYTIDVIRPCCFYKSFTDVIETISYFDISVNALAVGLHDKQLLDPLEGVADLLAHQVRTTGARWNEATDFEAVHLMLRLLRYVERYGLRLIDPGTIACHLDKLHTVNWDDVRKYHALTQAEAFDRLNSLATHGTSNVGRLSGD